VTPTTDGPKTAPSDATAVPFTLPGTVPAELAALPQWVAWWWEERDGKPAKSPLNPHTGAYAPTTDPATWGRLQDALRFCRKHSSAAGVGFVFTKDDRHAGFDLDKCRDPETGEIAPCAQAIVDYLSSYTEVSPSGKGVEIFTRGALPAAASGCCGETHTTLCLDGGRACQKFRHLDAFETFWDDAGAGLNGMGKP
jgi:hypothetical protein